MSTYEIAVLITTQCLIAFVCLALIISYIPPLEKINVLFLMTHIE